MELPRIDIDQHVITMPEEEEEEEGEAGEKTEDKKSEEEEEGEAGEKTEDKKSEEEEEGEAGEKTEDKKSEEEEEGEAVERTDGKKGEKEDENEASIDEFVNSLIRSSTMRTDIPLWDVHVLPQRRRTLVLRLHHALGDCLSLIAPLFASFDSEEPPSAVLSEIREGTKPTMEKHSLKAEVAETTRWAWRSVKAAWYTIPYAKLAPLLAVRLTEDKTMIRGETHGVGMPRNLTSLTLSLEDMRTVKNKVKATINDVFLGITACGIAKYFKSTPNGSSNLANLTALNVVSLRKEGLKDLMELVRHDKEIAWGNNIGHFLLRIDLREEQTDPLNYVRKSKEILDKRKLSMEASLSHYSSEMMMSMFGPQAYLGLACNLLSGISFLFSNVNGPAHPMAMEKNHITKIGFTANGLPVPIDVRMISYNGKAFLKVLTATKLIADPKLLCVCIRDALQEMLAT
ncbi:wax ester synthase/diacylglycerol acyltransferase 5-like isoform X2 [Wolffia australiana]